RTVTTRCSRAHPARASSRRSKTRPAATSCSGPGKNRDGPLFLDELGQVAEPADRAAAVPRGHLAIDEPRGFPEALGDLAPMLLAERIRLRRKQNLFDAGEPWLVERELRIAINGPFGRRVQPE